MITPIFSNGERYALRWAVLPLSSLMLFYCVWAWHPVVGLFALLSVAMASVFGFDMRRRNVLIDNRAPHERWPEILHWQKDDLFEVRGAYCGQAFLESVTESGSAYVIEGLSPQGGRPEKWAVSDLVGKNRSLRSRYISAEMKQSNEYMELLDAFHQSVEELRARDRTNGLPK